MTMWSAEPVLFTKRDYEGHRLRFTITEKRARCITRIIDRFNTAPEYMTEVNPEGIYPVLVDKHLICHGAALDELLHERYPGPTLLPSDPVARAQVRMLADKVRSWYTFRADQLADHILEVASVHNAGSLFFMGNAISIVDIALAPILNDMSQKLIAQATDSFLEYRTRLLFRPSFRLSMKPYVPSNEMIQEDDESDEETLYDLDADTESA